MLGSKWDAFQADSWMDNQPWWNTCLISLVMPNTSWVFASKALLFKVSKIRPFIHRSQWLLTVWPCPLLQPTLPAAGRCGPASAPFNFPSGLSCWQMAALKGKPFQCSSEEKQCPRLNWQGKEASSAAVTWLHAGVKAASRHSPSKAGDQACPSSSAPIVLMLGTNRVWETGILLAPPEQWGLAGKPPDSAILLSYSDIQWLFPMDLFRLSLHFCQDPCTSGMGKCRFFLSAEQSSGWAGSDLLGSLVLISESFCWLLK